MTLPADPNLPAWAVRLIGDLETSDRRANEVARGLDAAQINWKPSEGVWSVGQCLQHLLATNDVYLPPIAHALDGGTKAPVREITPGWFGRWFIRTYIEPTPRTSKARAPGKIAPAQHIDPAVLDLFLRSNGAVRDLVRRAAAYDVNRMRFKNPFVPLLRFTVGTGLVIVSRHQHRHLLQAEGIRHAAPFAAAR
ncbi:MAG: DinB family protein [Gammaproteobacteria bacterium]